MLNKNELDEQLFTEKLTSLLEEIHTFTPADLTRKLSELTLLSADRADMNVQIRTLNDHRHK